MKRLTNNDFNYTSDNIWELCGLDNACTRNCKNCHIPEIYQKLAEYENLEEKELLYREVWYIDSCFNYCWMPNCGFCGKDNYFIESKIVNFSELKEQKYYLSKKDAEKALENIKGIKNE